MTGPVNLFLQIRMFRVRGIETYLLIRCV